MGGPRRRRLPGRRAAVRRIAATVAWVSTYPGIATSSAIAGAELFHFEYCNAPYLSGGPMSYSSRSSATVLVLLALGASVASAQYPQIRKGFWIGFGAGYGSYGISCTGCHGLGPQNSVPRPCEVGGT